PILILFVLHLLNLFGINKTRASVLFFLQIFLTCSLSIYNKYKKKINKIYETYNMYKQQPKTAARTTTCGVVSLPQIINESPTAKQSE
ncbi:hypothetical protein M5D96_012594, partial [Drosophila gunungcola]